MSDTPPIVVRPSSISLEEACNARAQAWRFVFDCYERHRTARGNDRKDDSKSLPSEKGGHHDLAPNVVCNAEGVRQNKKGKSKND
jgi:hypothetical protein